MKRLLEYLQGERPSKKSGDSVKVEPNYNKCQSHKNQDCIMYCFDHKREICNACCNAGDACNECPKNSLESGALTVLANQVKIAAESKKGRVDMVLGIVQERERLLTENWDTMEAAINKGCDDLIQKLEEKRKELLAFVRTERDTVMHSLATETQILTACSAQLQDHLTFAEDAMVLEPDAPTALRFIKDAEHRRDTIGQIKGNFVVEARAIRPVILSTDHLLTTIQSYGQMSITAVATFKNLLICGCTDGAIRLWDLNSRQLVGKPMYCDMGEITALVRVGNKVIAACHREHLYRNHFYSNLCVWDLTTRKPIISTNCADRLWCLIRQDAPHGVHHIFAGDKDGGITKYIFRVREGLLREVETCSNEEGTRHDQSVLSLVISGDRLFSGGYDGTIRVWSADTLGFLQVLYDGDGSNVECLAVSGNRLFAGFADSTIRVWDLVTLQPVGQPLQGHSGAVRCLAIRGNCLLSGSDDKTIRVRDMTNLYAVGEPLQGHSGGVKWMAVADGQVFAGGADNETISEWRLDIE